jgi:hypothetical protein
MATLSWSAMTDLYLALTSGSKREFKASVCVQILIDLVFDDLRPATKAFMTAGWYSSSTPGQPGVKYASTNVSRTSSINKSNKLGFNCSWKSVM